MRTRIFFKILKILIALGLLFLIYYGLKEFYKTLNILDVKNIGAIITGSVTLIVGIGAVLIAQNKIKKRELAEAHREKKIELYNRFNDKIFELFAGVNENVTGKQPTEQNLIDFMMKFKKDLMFRASPKVIKSVIKFIEASNNTKKSKTVLRRVDDLYLAMREDIGLSNFGLDQLEMIQIFLKSSADKWEIK